MVNDSEHLKMFVVGCGQRPGGGEGSGLTMTLGTHLWGYWEGIEGDRKAEESIEISLFRNTCFLTLCLGARNVPSAKGVIVL